MQAASPGAGTYITCLAEGYFRLGTAATGLVTADVTQGDSAADRTAAQIYVTLLARAIAANPNTIALGFVDIECDDGDLLVTDDGIQLVAGEAVSSADVGALDTANSSVLGFWTDQETTIAAVIDQVAGSVGAAWWPDPSGTFRIAQLVAPSGTPVLTITANDMLKPPEIVTLNDAGEGLPAYRCTVRYGQSYTVQSTDLAGSVSDARRAVVAQQWRSAVASDTDVQIGHLFAPETSEDSLLTTLDDAQAEADRRLALRSVQRFRLQVMVPMTEETSAVGLNDVVEVVHPRFALSVVGTDGGVLYRVLDIVPDAENSRIEWTLWGRSTTRNLASDDGDLFVCDDGTYLVTADAA
jgi:hypothetical protein